MAWRWPRAAQNGSRFAYTNSVTSYDPQQTGTGKKATPEKVDLGAECCLIQKYSNTRGTGERGRGGREESGERKRVVAPTEVSIFVDRGSRRQHF